MIRANQVSIQDKKIKHKSGFDSNESRFGGWERELRKHKVLTVPSVGVGSASVTLEQGWNRRSRYGDVVKLKVKKGNNRLDVVVTREELEQACAYMAQGDEMIKWINPKISTSRQKI